MAFPTIIFNGDSGSGGNSASGAGPTIALTGIYARNCSENRKQVGFYDTAPDLSDVEVDGSHVIQLGTVSGRQWSKITAKKSAEQATTTDGEITAPATDISVDDASDMTIGDPIKISGAGTAAADHISVIDNIVGNTVTIHDATVTTVTDAIVRDPVYVTIEDSITLDTDTEWSIGGSRETISGAAQLWLDLKPGWSVEIQAATNPYEEASTTTLTVGGDTTSGRITIGASGRPILQTTGGAAPFFTLQADLYKFDGIDGGASTELVLINNDTVRNTILEDCRCTTDSYLVRVTSAVTAGYLTARSCEVFESSIKIQGVLDLLRVENTYFHGDSAARDGIVISTATPVSATDCVFRHILDAVNLGSASGISGASTIERCSVYDSEYGIRAAHLDRCRGLTIRNNKLDAAHYQIELVAGADAVVACVDYNELLTSSKLSNVTQGDHDHIHISDGYRDQVNDDFRIDLTGSADGFPSDLPASITTTKIDLGYAQRPEGPGGSIIARITDIIEDATSYTISYLVVGGNQEDCYRSVVILKTDLQASGDHEPAAVEGAAMAWLRENSADISGLIGREVLA